MPGATAHCGVTAVRRFVVVERDREERLVGRILGRQRLGGVRGEERVARGEVERVDRRGPDDGDVGDGAVAVDDERDDDPAAQRHRRIGHEPVALHLRDEAANPRPELDALGVELNRRPELLAAALLVVERLVSPRTLQVRAAPRPACRPAAAARGCGCCIAVAALGVWVERAFGRLDRWRRLGRGLLGRALAARPLLGPRLDALGRVAARVRQRVLHGRRHAPTARARRSRSDSSARSGGFGAGMSSCGCTKTKRGLVRLRLLFDA